MIRRVPVSRAVSCRRPVAVRPMAMSRPPRLIKEADPELEKLLDEEEEIARRTHGGSEAPHFRGED